MNSPIVEMSNISKSFPGVCALKNVNFAVNKGEVHALVGENGAGKSTLIKILGGIYRKDSGQIKLRGSPVEISSPQHAIENGISVIHQELMLVPEMTIAQNIFLGRCPSRWGVLECNKMNARADELLNRFDLKVDAKTPVKRLGIGQQQMVEIVKAVSLNASVLVMDEPTAPLTDNEIVQLFSLIQKLKLEGVSIIYISHRLEEVFQIADRVTVLRDGSTIATMDIEQADAANIIRLMVGREIGELFVKENIPTDEEILRTENLSSKKVSNISFHINKGEIIGVAGLIGSGRTELAQAIFGVDQLTSGCVYIKGERVRIRSPQEAISNGIYYLSEDRKHLGIIPEMSVESNISIAVLPKCSTGFVVRKKAKRTLGETYQKKLSIKSSSMHVPVKSLSGGNQQKVLIARGLATSVPVLIFDEPTRGIDVGAKHEIYSIMSKLAQQGYAIIMISSELREIIAMSDRILVMHAGEIAGEITPKDATQENILNLAMGKEIECR
jgi:ribose transport system ATP-binding protein